MAHNFNTPAVTSQKTDFPTECRNGIFTAAQMDYASDTNIPNGVMKYNRSTSRWQQRESGVFVDKELDNLKDGAVSTTAKLADNIITTNKHQNASITGGKIASATITGSNIASATITGSNIAATTIAAGNLDDTCCSLLGFWGPASMTSQLAAGYMPIGPESLANYPVAYNLFSQMQMPRAFTITHMCIGCTVNPGDLIGEVYHNNVATGRTITLTTTGQAFQALTPLNVSAGDLIGFSVRHTSAGITDDVTGTIWGHPR